MKKIILIITSLVISGSVYAAGDVAKGKAKSALCVACHGAAGISMVPMWPNLAGQKAVYLVKQLKDFKSGARKDPSMKSTIDTNKLTDQDFEDLAAYYSQLK